MLCNVGHPSVTHVKPKFHEIAFAHNLFLSYPIVMKFCIEHGSAKLQNSWTKAKKSYGQTRLCEISLLYEFWTDNLYCTRPLAAIDDDVITWKRLLRFWPFVRRIPLSHVEFPQKSHQCEALMFPLMLVCRHCWTNSRCQWFERGHNAYTKSL